MATQKPTAHVRIGNVEAAIWKNETESGMRYNLKFKRHYKDGDAWKSSESFRRDDLLVLAKVADTAAFDKALRQAMNRLGARAMSRRRLDRKLRDLEHPEPLRTQVLDRLTDLGLLDDEALAAAVVRDLLGRKPAGPALLKKKLFEQGFDGSLIDRVVAEATDDDDAQLGAALELARKKSASMTRLDPQVRRRRLYGQLARRGFDLDTIRAAMDKIEREEDADGPGV